MSNGLIIKSSPSDFCDFLDGKCGDIGNLLQGKLQELEQTAMCLAMAVINKLCSNGTSPVQPLHETVQKLQIGMARCSTMLTSILYPDNTRDTVMSPMTDALAAACNSVIMQMVAQVNTMAMQITSFMNTVKGIADSVITAFTSAIELGAAGLVCLIPLLEKVRDIAWLLDMFKGFEDYLDIDYMKILYGLTDRLINVLLGYLFPSLSNCSL